MSDAAIGLTCIIVSIFLIQTGMHIAISLMLLSFIGIWLVRGTNVAGAMLSRSAYDSIAIDALAVIPLFVLMGLLVSGAGIGRDTFNLASRAMRGVRGGLGMSTVGANAVFAACTGTSIASASVFTRIAVPEMLRYGYSPRFAVGCVAGSSVLGMLIPPSLLFIIYGIIAQVSIGHLFIAGILPGLLLAVAYVGLIWGMARFSERRVYATSYREAQEIERTNSLEITGSLISRLAPVFFIVGIVLGGIYAGFFTPNQAGAVGAAAAFLVGLYRRLFSPKGLLDIALETGRVTAAILFLLMAAQMYSQMLTVTGLPEDLARWVEQSKLSFPVLITGYLLLVMLMGCFLDSLSIMLIIVPFALEIIPKTDLIWFGVITVVAVEIGLLTPPFGVACFVTHSNLQRKDITLNDVFAGTLPFMLMMLLVLIILTLFPQISTALL
jgi:C4-dicarboxylate transporter DctM subunit